jgi:hypothetical protein
MQTAFYMSLFLLFVDQTHSSLHVSVSDYRKNGTENFLTHQNLIVKVDTCDQCRSKITLVAIGLTTKDNVACFSIVEQVQKTIKMSGGDNATIIGGFARISTIPFIDCVSYCLDKVIKTFLWYKYVIYCDTTLHTLLEKKKKVLFPRSYLATVEKLSICNTVSNNLHVHIAIHKGGTNFLFF